MVKEKHKEYMKVYNRSEKAKAAKAAWRQSEKGQKFHVEYEVAYMAKEENKERKASKQKERRRTSPERRLIDATYNYAYARRPEVKAAKNAKRRAQRQADPKYRVMERLRGRIKDLLGRDKPAAVSKSIGCTADELVNHLENQFQPGMNWDNYGFYGWHIDHILPLSSFDLTDLIQYKKACHYTNLRPLWAKDNLQKGARIV